MGRLPGRTPGPARITAIDVDFESLIMAKNEKTSPTVASKASKVLSNPKSTPAQKSVAGSALTQARDKSAPKK